MRGRPAPAPAAAAGERGIPFQATGCGSIIGLHWQAEPVRRPADTEATRPEARALAHLEMIRHGFYFARRGFMSLSLPLAGGDYDDFMDAFSAFLEEHRKCWTRILHEGGNFGFWSFFRFHRRVSEAYLGH